MRRVVFKKAFIGFDASRVCFFSIDCIWGYAMELGLPWTEKYRPHKLKDVEGQREIVKRLEAYAKTGDLPHMMFAGPAGVGKTTCSIALARELFGENYKANFLELNASDERGIAVVRGIIKDFSRTLPFGGSKFKVIFLDESDALTPDAQHALRRTMETYAATVRFILSCNFSSKVIPPIQSRCAIFRFEPLHSKDVAEYVHKIAKAEGVHVDEKGMDAIVYAADGDMRYAINILQGASSATPKVTEEVVFSVVSQARPKEVREMLELALECKFTEARERLGTLMYKHGMSGEDVVRQVYKEFSQVAVPDEVRIELVDKIGEYNFRLAEGANEKIQLEALLAQFGKYKSKINGLLSKDAKH